ncbi:hypothetical protein ACVI3S_003474 [Bradyrhizobium diazoefficiens]
MIADGFAATAMSSSSGRLARLQVMKPIPNGARRPESFAVSRSSHARSP